MFYKKLF